MTGRVTPTDYPVGVKIDTGVSSGHAKHEAMDLAGKANGPEFKIVNGDSSKNEKDDDEKKKEEPQKTVGLFELFRFAKCPDVVLMIFGGLTAAINGGALPAFIIIFGEMIDLFVENGLYLSFLSVLAPHLADYNLTSNDYTVHPDKVYPFADDLQDFLPNVTNFKSIVKYQMDNSFLDMMEFFALIFIGVGLGVLLCAYAQVTFWMISSERQTFQIRKHFFQSILRQDIGWFDTHESGELNTKLADDIMKISDGIGDKVGTCIQWTMGFLVGFAIGFAYGWKLTLVILAVSPALAISAFIMTKLLATMSGKELKAYSKAGAIAEEVLSSIRTVVAFGGQDKEVERYSKNLIDAKNYGIRKGFTNGLSNGVIWMLVMFCYALGFWYGAQLTREEPENYSIGRVLIVFFSVVIGAFSIGHASPSLQSLATARGAAYSIYQLIDEYPEIDSSSTEGLKPATVVGNIQFKGIHFTYPSRKDVKVLNDVSIMVNRGQTVALVGSSGCGKSTMVQLIQRFYDPEQGQIFFDDHDIKTLNIKWLRQHIGIVSQEPVLFGTTIAENIRYGREDVTQEEIEAACKMANAHNFISKLPDKYETLVGERGAQLSGGQKQRVAIARALVRDPKVLLLDEATSALDTESEAVVQEALDKARAGRTTIVIAHRLSTIKNADRIVGFRDGCVVEQGTHDELMKTDGIYKTLVTHQISGFDEEDKELAAEFDEQRGKSKMELKKMISGHEVERRVSVIEEKKEEEEKKKNASFKRVMRLNAPEWHFILLASLGSIFNGGVQPAFGVIFAEILGVFSLTDKEEQEKEISKFSLFLIGLGLISFFAYFAQGYLFGKSGENLTERIRKMSFKCLLRQDISFFDDHRNNTGALTTRLASDASLVQGAAGVRIGVFIQNLANIGTAIVIAFVYGWQLTLLILGFLPLIAMGGALQMQVLSGVAGKNKEALEGAGKVAVESIENIRTVASLSLEPRMYENYVHQLTGPFKAALRKAHVVGIGFSVSQAVMYFAYAASFYLGAYLIEQGEMDYVDVFKVFSVIVFGAMALGEASSFVPDAAKAQTAAGEIFFLLDRVPAIDSQSTEGDIMTEGDFSSAVTFKDVKFRYPTRPDIQVLQGLNIMVHPGETLALVGTSGCGKSTSVQLIERFYDTEDGGVFFDKKNVRDLNIQWLRKQIGIVSQEPVLFDCSIAENIAYGDNSRVVPMDEIITAARKANIHSFIDSLPTGYDTNVGDKGTQLSGGQKQRVAIARALVRNPKILLLDEATSALDTESEKVVQEALDQARIGRTCVVIAHRLSTIQNADRICVIRNGVVTEEGTHTELMAHKEFYYKLNLLQLRQR